MLGKTHRAGGALFALGAFELMRHNGMLLPDVNPFIQLAIMYPAAAWGSTAPDLDHHWASVGEKTPLNMVFHKLLHLTKPKHRSWQTHSLLVTGGFLFLLYALVSVGNMFWSELNSFDWIILRLIVVGMMVGVASHLFLDMINPSGIYLYPGRKFRLVPRTSFFATGGPWEDIVYRLCIGGSLFLFIALVLSLFDISVYEYIKILWEYIINKITGS